VGRHDRLKVLQVCVDAEFAAVAALGGPDQLRSPLLAPAPSPIKLRHLQILHKTSFNVIAS
jgi:hypothetical protein